MQRLSEFPIFWRNPFLDRCDYQEVLLRGVGVSFLYDVENCVNTCKEITNIPVISVYAGWTRYEVVLTSNMVTAINGNGLNLTNLEWTYVATSTGETPTSFSVKDVPFQVALNGNLLSLGEYAVENGVIRLVPPTLAEEGDLVSIWVMR